jgi:hypothetical protein
MEVSDNPQQQYLAPFTYTLHSGNNSRPLPPPTINGTSHSSTPTNHIMSQQSFSALVDVPEMDDAMSEDVPVTQNAPTTRATATSSSRGRGRGRWPRARTSRVTKPAQQKPTAGRGRRQKVYESLKVQAAHERIQELRQAYSSVVRLVKPAVQELADRNINELLEDPTAYKQVPEYEATKNFLRQRRDDTIKQCNDRLQHGLAMVENVWQAQHQKVDQEYTVRITVLSRSPPPVSRLTCHFCRPWLPSYVKADTASSSGRSTLSSTSTITACLLMCVRPLCLCSAI